MDKQKQKALDEITIALHMANINEINRALEKSSKSPSTKENNLFVIAMKKDLLTSLYKGFLENGPKGVLKFLRRFDDKSFENNPESIFRSDTYSRDVRDGLPKEGLDQLLGMVDKADTIISSVGLVGSRQSGIVPHPTEDKEELNEMIESLKDFKKPILIAPGYYRNTKPIPHYQVDVLMCSDTEILAVKDNGNLADPSSLVDTENDGGPEFVEIVNAMGYLLVESNKSIVNLIKSL